MDETFLAACMDKRRARGDGLSTPRVEADAVQLLSLIHIYSPLGDGALGRAGNFSALSAAPPLRELANPQGFD